MRLTKFGHACVRIEHDGHAVVLDPGGWTEPEAVDGADAVLITHEHPDHVDPDRLRRTDAPVHTIQAVADRLPADLAERVHVVKPTEHVELPFEGWDVEVVGDKHAVIHPELPHFDNSGFLLTVDGRTVFHPGDALTDPHRDIDVLLLPVSAPWLKVAECIDFGRDVGAARNLAVHDMVYSAEGLGVVDGHLQRFLGDQGQEYVRLSPGTDLD